MFLQYTIRSWQLFKKIPVELNYIITKTFNFCTGKTLSAHLQQKAKIQIFSFEWPMTPFWESIYKQPFLVSIAKLVIIIIIIITWNKHNLIKKNYKKKKMQRTTPSIPKEQH